MLFLRDYQHAISFYVFSKCFSYICTYVLSYIYQIVPMYKLFNDIQIWFVLHWNIIDINIKYTIFRIRVYVCKDYPYLLDNNNSTHMCNMTTNMPISNVVFSWSMGMSSIISTAISAILLYSEIVRRNS